MPYTIAILLKKLKKAFPDRYVAISIDYGIFAHKEEIEIEYNLYVSENPEYCRILNTLQDLKSYVEYICRPLYAKDMLIKLYNNKELL